MSRIILLICISILLIGCNTADEAIIYNTPHSFLFSEPAEQLTEDLELADHKSFLLKYNPYYEDLTCTSGKKAKRYTLFYQEFDECPEGVVGCLTDIERSAYVCDKAYVIEHYRNDIGPYLYGPFPLEENSS